MDAWVQWTSFLLQVGIALGSAVDVFVKGALAVSGRPLLLRQGDLVSVVPRGTAPPSAQTLSYMLRRGPQIRLCFTSLAGTLSSCSPTDSVGSSKSTDSLLEILKIFGLLPVPHSIALPWPCHARCVALVTKSACTLELRAAIVLATTRLNRMYRIPVPPGCIFPRQVVAFFDLRAILRGFTWQIMEDGFAKLIALEHQFRDAAPGFQVCVRGGTPELIGDVTSQPHTPEQADTSAGSKESFSGERFLRCSTLWSCACKRALFLNAGTFLALLNSVLPFALSLPSPLGNAASYRRGLRPFARSLGRVCR